MPLSGLILARLLLHNGGKMTMRRWLAGSTAYFELDFEKISQAYYLEEVSGVMEGKIVNLKSEVLSGADAVRS